MNDRRYVMNVAISDMDFWREPKDTWRKIGAAVPGVETMFGGPPEGKDVSRQIQELEMLILERVSGLVVFSDDSDAITPTINRAVENGIPVITAFADAPNSDRLAHVGTDQAGLAREIVRKVLEEKEFDGRFDNCDQRPPRALVLVGRKTSKDQAERLDAITAALKARKKVIEIITKEDEFKADQAERLVRDAFKDYKNQIDFIFGCNSRSAVGAVRAVSDSRKPGEVVITGWDADMDLMKLIVPEVGHRSWVHATAVLYSSYTVQVCFAILESANFGYLYPDTLNTRELKLPPVPPIIRVPEKDVVTSQNVVEYLGKL